MRVLVAVASKHGATADIAEAIGDELRAQGLEAEVWDADVAPALAGYDAAVIGSGVYAGRWLGSARAFVADNQDELATMPVWLFSSGPLGEEPPKQNPEPAAVKKLSVSLHARDHVTFDGKLDRHDLGFGERLIMRLVHAPEGDFRDWAAVRSWARDIAAALLAPTPAT